MRIFRNSLFALFLLALPAFAAGGFHLSSPDFADGASIPARFTCQGENTPPTLAIAGVPSGARSMVLIVDDPDAPSGTFTHWLVWNIRPDSKRVFATSGPQGTNDFGSVGYSGPCPPSGTHRYFFRLSALNTILNLPAGASRKEVDAAIGGHGLATATLMGRYSR